MLNSIGFSSSPRLSPLPPSGAALLGLFSSERRQTAAPDLGSEDRRALWAADAVHRAKNLAQLTSSLGSPGLRSFLGAKAAEYGAPARDLARAYAELGAVDVSEQPVPCGTLLETIGTRLIALFCGDRAISVHVSTDYLLLPADQRRALVLIGSELVINVLKYAFPPASAGAISLTLTVAKDCVELAVGDNGQGVAAHASVGTGSLLMVKLASLLSAEMHHSDNKPGLRVCVRIPRQNARGSDRSEQPGGDCPTAAT